MKRSILIQRGVSLIEALVAMAIMAFGMLALLGLQGALRGNSDVSKQRSEAVRYAQEQIELLRGFSTLDTATGARTYAQIALDTGTSVSLPGYATSASFTREVSVTAFPPTTPSDFDRYYSAPHKNVNTRVSWTDRSNNQQWVQLNTMIARIAPEIVGALSVPATGSAAQGSASRSVQVPVNAVDLGNGTSQFTPPGAATGVTWIFDNISGLITKLCAGTTCTAANLQLLSGYVRFALTSSQPQPADAESPPNIRAAHPAVGVLVATRTPTVSTTFCYTESSASDSYVAYFCAVPVTSGVAIWSGQSLVTLNGYTSGSGGYFASSICDATVGLFRVCRYTTARAQTTIPNAEHPFEYVSVAGSLINQNFLIIRAGNGSASYDCPNDDPATPVYGRTWHHQPST